MRISQKVLQLLSQSDDEASPDEKAAARPVPATVGHKPLAWKQGRGKKSRSEQLRSGHVKFTVPQKPSYLAFLPAAFDSDEEKVKEERLRAVKSKISGVLKDDDEDNRKDSRSRITRMREGSVTSQDSVWPESEVESKRKGLVLHTPQTLKQLSVAEAARRIREKEMSRDAKVPKAEIDDILTLNNVSYAFIRSNVGVSRNVVGPIAFAPEVMSSKTVHLVRNKIVLCTSKAQVRPLAGAGACAIILTTAGDGSEIHWNSGWQLRIPVIVWPKYASALAVTDDILSIEFRSYDGKNGPPGVTELDSSSRRRRPILLKDFEKESESDEETELRNYILPPSEMKIHPADFEAVNISATTFDASSLAHTEEKAIPVECNDVETSGSSNGTRCSSCSLSRQEEEADFLERMIRNSFLQDPQAMAEYIVHLETHEELLRQSVEFQQRAIQEICKSMRLLFSHQDFTKRIDVIFRLKEISKYKASSYMSRCIHSSLLDEVISEKIGTLLSQVEEVTQTCHSRTVSYCKKTIEEIVEPALNSISVGDDMLENLASSTASLAEDSDVLTSALCKSEIGLRGLARMLSGGSDSTIRALLTTISRFQAEDFHHTCLFNHFPIPKVCEAVIRMSLAARINGARILAIFLTPHEKGRRNIIAPPVMELSVSLMQHLNEIDTIGSPSQQKLIEEALDGLTKFLAICSQKDSEITISFSKRSSESTAEKHSGSLGPVTSILHAGEERIQPANPSGSVSLDNNLVGELNFEAAGVHASCPHRRQFKTRKDVMEDTFSSQNETRHADLENKHSSEMGVKDAHRPIQHLQTGKIKSIGSKAVAQEVRTDAPGAHTSNQAYAGMDISSIQKDLSSSPGVFKPRASKVTAEARANGDAAPLTLAKVKAVLLASDPDAISTISIPLLNRTPGVTALLCSLLEQHLPAEDATTGIIITSALHRPPGLLGRVLSLLNAVCCLDPDRAVELSQSRGGTAALFKILKTRCETPSWGMAAASQHSPAAIAAAPPGSTFSLQQGVGGGGAATGWTRAPDLDEQRLAAELLSHVAAAGIVRAVKEGAARAEPRDRGGEQQQEHQHQGDWGLMDATLRALHTVRGRWWYRHGDDDGGGGSDDATTTEGSALPPDGEPPYLAPPSDFHLRVQ